MIAKAGRLKSIILLEPHILTLMLKGKLAYDVSRYGLVFFITVGRNFLI